MSEPKPRAIVIDGDSDVLAQVSAALQGEYRVLTFSDPAAGIAAAMATPPSILVTAISMAGQSGAEVIRALRAVPETVTTPIVVLSSQGDENSIRTCLALGAADYLAKPLVATELRGKLATVLARASAAGMHGKDPTQLKKGDVFAEYTIVRLVAEGGMGLVYEATAPDGTSVAIKMMAHELSTHADMLARFVREARNQRAVEHRNVVRCLGFGHSEGVHYLVMEYVDGPTLDEHLVGRMPVPEHIAISLVIQIAEALEALSARGIVHRDLKPGNVLVTPGAVLKLTDFGITRQETDFGLTSTDAVMGSPAYIAPELMKEGVVPDGRCDLYSLGVLFFYLIVGRLPFDAPTPLAMVALQTSTDVPDPAEVKPLLTPETAAIIRRLVERDPDKRYPSATDLLVELRARREILRRRSR